MATNAGIILGTAAYMSPEQAKGFAADHRSDVFSFGVVLYEMLTGRQPFQGETAPDVLASVLVREPELQRLPTDLNPRIAELLRRCLEKNPKRRWQAIGDLRAEIEALMSSPRAVPSHSTIAAPPKPLWRRALPIAAAAILAAVLERSRRLATEAVTAKRDRAVLDFAARRRGAQRCGRTGRGYFTRWAPRRVFGGRDDLRTAAVGLDRDAAFRHAGAEKRVQSHLLARRTARRILHRGRLSEASADRRRRRHHRFPGLHPRVFDDVGGKRHLLRVGGRLHAGSRPRAAHP